MLTLVLFGHIRSVASAHRPINNSTSNSATVACNNNGSMQRTRIFVGNNTVQNKQHVSEYFIRPLQNQYSALNSTSVLIKYAKSPRIAANHWRVNQKQYPHQIQLFYSNNKEVHNLTAIQNSMQNVSLIDQILAQILLNSQYTYKHKRHSGSERYQCQS